ncbi:12154_t:CDS:2, partial [Acaulospora colombiana]
GGESLGDHVATDPSRWADWTDGLNMLRRDGGHVATSETADFVHALTEIGLKIKLLDLSGEKVDIPSSLMPGSPPVARRGTEEKATLKRSRIYGEDTKSGVATRRWFSVKKRAMKITQKIAKAEKEDRIWWSFEYFPPRTAQGLQNLLDRIERMRGLGPEFIDITWNAGGRTSDLTSELVKTCQKLIGIETCMHLTCTNMPKEKVDIALREAKLHGCRNILALRGDPPAGQDEWTATEGGFVHGIDLVRHIRKHYGDYFEIAVAGFPEHQMLPEEELQKELAWLKEKIDAGVSFIFTQMFYDIDVFVKWVHNVRKAGITVPIVPGINPIKTWNGFMKATSLAKITIPRSFLDVLEPHKNNDEMVRELGTKLVTDLCRKILSAGL